MSKADDPELSLEEIRALVTKVNHYTYFTNYRLHGFKGRLRGPRLPPLDVDSADKARWRSVWGVLYEPHVSKEERARLVRVADYLNKLGVKEL